MGGSLAFCLSMMLGGILLAETWFGVVRPKDHSALQARAKFVPSAPRKQPDDNRPPPPPEPGANGPDAGKPAPLQPRPGHHLMAANALPPGERVYLLRKIEP